MLTLLIGSAFCIFGVIGVAISVMQDDKFDSLFSFILAMVMFAMMFVCLYGPYETYMSGYNNFLRHRKLGDEEHTENYLDGFNDAKRDFEEAGKEK